MGQKKYCLKLDEHLGDNGLFGNPKKPIKKKNACKKDSDLTDNKQRWAWLTDLTHTIKRTAMRKIRKQRICTNYGSRLNR